MSDTRALQYIQAQRPPWVHPGPRGGEGRGPGKPFAGVVEDTPCLWVSWFRALARGFGFSMQQMNDQVPGLIFASQQLTYGERWYFQCPRCGRRCEALYLVEGLYACRHCHHLGYASQCHRPGSPELTLRDVFRRGPPLPARHAGAGSLKDSFEAMLRWQAEQAIQAILQSLRFRDD